MISRPFRLLSDFVATDYAVSKELTTGSVYQLANSARHFERWFLSKKEYGERFDIGLATSYRVSLFLKELTDGAFLDARSKQFARATIHKIRGDLKAILREAARHGLCDKPRNIRTVKRHKPRPRAYTPAQVAAIVAASSRLPGRLQDGVQRGAYFSTVGLVAWEIGFARKDLFALRQSDFRSDGLVVLDRAKTGEQQIARVYPDTLERVRRLGERPLCWRWAPRGFYYWWRRAVQEAGVPYLGGLHAFRRSASTDVAKNNPGAETKFLGHSTPAADSFYIDRTLLAENAIQPTRIEIATCRQMTLFS